MATHPQSAAGSTARVESATGPRIVITMGWGLGTHTGVARHARELARHLALAGASVTLLCVETAGYTRFPRPPLPQAMRGTRHEKALREAGVRVVRVQPHRLHWMLDGRPVAHAVRELLKKERVHAVLGFFNEAAYLPRLLEKHRIPFGYIATWLSYRMALAPERQGRGARRVLKKYANRRFIVDPYRRADVLFANSEFTQHELVDVIGVDPERIRVTYLGVEPSFGSIPRVHPEHIRRLIFFGRLVPEKGIGDAVQALAKVSERGNRSWKLHIIGSGHVEHVRGMARELGIADHLVFADHMGDRELRQELERAELAVLPSHSESFGLSIAEAQAAGLAVVAYAAGSVPEVVRDKETAWLAPTGDVEALSYCLEEALAYPMTTYKRGMRGRAHATELFRWEKTAAQVLRGLSEIALGT